MAVLSLWLGWLDRRPSVAAIADDHRDRARDLRQQPPSPARPRKARTTSSSSWATTDRRISSPASRRPSRPSVSSSRTRRTSCAPRSRSSAHCVEVALSDPNASIDSYRHTCEQLLAVGDQQERLIESLLTLSRSQRGLDDHQPVDLAAIAAGAAAAADHHGLSLETTIQPARTTGNPRLVDRLVANLLNNAVDHNVEGGAVTVSTQTRDGHAVLTVTNTGPKIPESELDRIFLPFERLDPARTSNGRGLGLGLSIVRAIADAHDATITTRAPSDGGLSIQVSFPAV